MSDLTYSVARELLWGKVGAKEFSIPASSGGGRGATTAGLPETTFASYSPYRRMNASKGVRGGAIPPGQWNILPPVIGGDSKGPWVSRLVPDETTRKDNPHRDYDVEPFKIHGRGPKGSDGCLVIEYSHRKPLLEAVQAAGGATLTVLWDGERMNERIELNRQLKLRTANWA